MRRYLQQQVREDLEKKIVLISGPRQSGKTTLSKQLFNEYVYLNYDSPDNRLQINAMQWDRSKPLLVLDELHKKPEWKRWLKGVYDTEGLSPRLLVTGSARLDTYKRVGDSLAGRFFSFELHPFDLKEVLTFSELKQEDAFDRLWKYSGFPEPFLEASESYHRRWRHSHLDIILREDMEGLFAISDLNSLKTLVLLLQKRVGSTVSYTNLARDLEKDPKTVKHWLNILESLYIVFRVTPYHKNVARSLLKEPKFYFYDWTYIEDAGARLENLVACALKKELQFICDVHGYQTALHYLRTRDGRELDFLTIIDDKPRHMLEVKLGETDIARHFSHFHQFFSRAKMLQLVKNAKDSWDNKNGVRVQALIPWLADIDLLSN